MRAIRVLACGAALALAAGPSAAQAPELRQLFSVRTQGERVVSGGVDLPGVAFAVTSDVLVTAPRAIGAAKDFKAAPQFGEGGVPARTIELRDMREDSLTPAVVPAGVRSSGGRVALLVPGGQQPPPLTPLRMSACALKDGNYEVLASADAGAAPVRLRPVFANGVVTHFTVRSPQGGWAAAQKALGAPVLDPEGRVAGVLTDAAADGLDVEVTPIAEVADLLPGDAAMDCDPRVDAEAFAAMQREVETLSRRVTAAEETGRLTMSVLADVGTDLERYLEASKLGLDTQPLLESMRERLKISDRLVPTVSAIAPTVSDIEAFLRRPAWTSRAKFEGDLLQMTFTYRTQLPGSRVSDRLRLCMRLLKPFHSDEAGHQNFRTPDFYSAARREDEDRLVRCNQAKVTNSAGRTDGGEYRFEVFRDDLEAMFTAYRSDRDWLPSGYDWSGLAYAVLIKPGTGVMAAAGGEEESQEPGADAAAAADAEGDGQDAQDEAREPEEVILRALVVVPEARTDQAGALPVQCVLFENDQSVIDFLAQRAPRSPGAALDDVSGLELDPQNTSDECVLASAQ